MRQTYTLFIYIVLAALSMTSCSDDFDINKISTEPKLILYCMPTVGDTTVIKLTRSLPVNHKGYIRPVTTANIDYTVNGKAAQIINMGDGTYKAVAHQVAGDRIDITAQADSLAIVSASTSILDAVEISNPSVKKVHLYSNYDDMAEDFYQIAATFTDDASTKDYYAVQVVSGSVVRKGEIYTQADGMSTEETNETDTVESLRHVYLDSEPLISGLSSVDYELGYEDKDYDHFYVFTDDDINGKTYTLHLNVWYDKDFENVELPDGTLCLQELSPYYRVILYHITPEFYHFVHSIGSLDDNDLAKAGLSNIAPTYSNVQNGFGMHAGYHKAKTPWTRYAKTIQVLN